MKSAFQFLMAGLSGGAYWWLAYQVPRKEFWWLAGLLGLAFGLYFLLLNAKLSVRQGLVLALLLRLLWLPALPTLSDDYQRFRWDGILVANGINPFQYRPEQLLGSHPQSTAVNVVPTEARRQLQAIYPHLNSPRYYSVYPPVCQAVFGSAALLLPASELGFVAVLRVVILLAEAAAAVLLLSLLRHFGLPTQRAFWYLLNPLVIVELTGNLHFEALVICFLLLMLWLFTRGRVVAASGALALAVATKLLPLLVLPLLVKRLGWRTAFTFGLVLGVCLLLVFAPFLSAELLRNIGRSLNLYFRSFEFNASVYYLLRALGDWYTGYNQIARIGPALALATASGGLLLAACEQRVTWATLPKTLLLLFTLYFLLATIVHPWYLTPLVALSVFTRLRYALVWSGLACVSYAAYRTSAYTEDMWLIGFEYGVMLVFLAADLWQGRASSAPSPGQHLA